MGTVSLEGMEFFAHHGCLEEEQIIGNRFVVDLYLETNTAEAEIADDLHKTVNYQKVYEIVKQEMEVTSKLLEHLARRISTSVMNAFPAIKSLQIKVTKMNPPLGGKVDSVSVTINSEQL